MVFLFLLIIPLLVAVGTFLAFNKKVTWWEFLIQIGVQVVIAAICCGVMYWSNTSDVEVWNGHVSEKHWAKVHCRHDYCCGYCESCSTDSKGNTSCHTYCCHTCYDHPYDIDWLFHTTDNGEGDIDTIDRQGLKEPPRWTAIRVGEPSSSKHGYTNYIKAAPGSLFRDQGLVEQFKKELPGYPGHIYDIYRLDRVNTIGLSLANIKAWNEELSEVNTRLNPAKEVNAILFITRNKSHDYFLAMRQHFLGGKKNDVILVINTDDNKNITWVDTMAWTDHSEIIVKLRDAIMDLKTFDPSNPKQILVPLEENIKQFYVRKSMKDFKYLASTVTPSVTQWIVCLIIGFLSSIGLAYYMVVNEFDEESEVKRKQFRYGYYRRR